MITSIKVTDTSFLGQLIKNDPGAFARVKIGEVIAGTVLKKGSNMLLVDLGAQGTGIVYRGELQNARELVRGLEKGDRIHGKVVDPDNEEGLVELSISEANRQKAWGELTELFEKGEIIPVKVKSFNRGGLTVECVGVNAFLPISQIAQERYPKTSEDDRSALTQAFQGLIGQEIKVKIIDLNSRNNKIIVSEREALEPDQKELAKNYTAGQTIDGVVVGVADFGVFIKFTDNPLMEGVIPVGELSHRLVENPKEHIKIDAPIRAKIIEIRDGKIYLSVKALQTDPWGNASEIYAEGMDCKGIVYAFTPFGAVVALQGDLQGQLHITEFGSLEEMKKNLPLGKEVACNVLQVVPEEKRISLKLK